MAINDAHWSINRDTKVISYIGDDHDGASPSYATVIDFHRWLQSLADDAVATGDDELDITNVDPSRRSTDNIITLINGYTLYEAGATPASEHLYDGSIIQNGGDDIWDGIVNFGNSDVQIQIIQDGSVLSDDWWNHRDKVYGDGGLNYSDTQGISHRFMIKVRESGADIDGRRLIGTSRRFGYTYAEFSINGTSRGNNVLALSDSNDLNNETVLATVSGWSTITNLTEGYIGLDVDNNGTPEYYYSQWDRDVYTINQFYERMKYITRDGSGETLYGLNGELFRGITHEINYGSLSGTFDEAYPIAWSGTYSGTGQVLADNGSNKVWIQILTGQAPAASDSLEQVSPDAATATVSSTTDRSATVSKPFVGASTGSAIIGAYGVGIEVADLTSADKVTDLTNAVVPPPNYVTNTVAGLASGEDRVLVAPWDGSSYDVNGDPEINKSQLVLVSGLTTDDITEVVVSGIGGATIPSDTPSDGYIRVTDNNGFERRLHYSAWSGYVFTISGGDYGDGNEDFNSVNADAGNNAYIAYIDELAEGTLVNDGSLTIGVTYKIETTGTSNFVSVGAADSNPGTIFTATGTDGGGNGTVRIYTCSSTFTSVQAGSRDLLVLVRDGASTPIKQFISSWSQTTSPQTITAIRTTDA